MPSRNPSPPGGSVLVTGASGFLGRHILANLADNGRRGVGLVRDAASFASQDWLGEVGNPVAVAGGLEDRTSWIEHGDLGDCDAIIHSAALVKHSRDDADEVDERDGTRGSNNHGPHPVRDLDDPGGIEEQHHHEHARS